MCPSFFLIHLISFSLFLSLFVCFNPLCLHFYEPVLLLERYFSQECCVSFQLLSTIIIHSVTASLAGRLFVELRGREGHTKLGVGVLFAERNARRAEPLTGKQLNDSSSIVLS